MSKRDNAGYTLLELLVVLALVSAAMALALPSISSFLASLEAKSDALRVGSAIAEARSKAVRERIVYSVGVSGTALFVKTPEGRVVRELRFSGGNEPFSDGPIKFYPGGYSSGGEVLVRSGDNGYSVIVTAAGRPRIERLR